MRIGFIGLGKMGKNMVLHLLDQKIEVVAWNRSSAPLQEVVALGALKAQNLAELVSKITTPRIIWLMLPQGAPTDEILNQLKPLLGKGDLVVDGANAYYKDSQKRFEELRALGIRFVDIGVSGGPDGARSGACLMIGGEENDYQEIKDLVTAIAAPGAYGYFGQAGAGHFAKMVHNGIEYGMMQAIAEGAAVLKSSQYGFDLAEVFRVYNLRSVIESRLVGWAAEALTDDKNLTETSSKIDHTGEGEWSIKEAKSLGVDVPAIEAAYSVRVASQKIAANSANGFRNKVVSALRGKFGHHDVKR